MRGGWRGSKYHATATEQLLKAESYAANGANAARVCRVCPDLCEVGVDGWLRDDRVVGHDHAVVQRFVLVPVGILTMNPLGAGLLPAPA